MPVLLSTLLYGVYDSANVMLAFASTICRSDPRASGNKYCYAFEVYCATGRVARLNRYGVATVPALACSTTGSDAAMSCM